MTECSWIVLGYLPHEVVKWGRNQTFWELSASVHLQNFSLMVHETLVCSLFIQLTQPVTKDRFIRIWSMNCMHCLECSLYVYITNIIFTATEDPWHLGSLLCNYNGTLPFTIEVTYLLGGGTQIDTHLPVVLAHDLFYSLFFLFAFLVLFVSVLHVIYWIFNPCPCSVLYLHCHIMHYNAHFFVRSQYFLYTHCPFSSC